MKTSVVFVEKQNGPERFVADAELVFEDGELEGMKLVGFALWRSADGEIYVTFPSRTFGTMTERKYFDYLRSSDGVSTIKRVKDWIIEEFKAHQEAA